MEPRIEREWKSIVCPEGKGESVVMREWEIVSEGDDTLRRTLKQIDCHNPRLTELGGKDCTWACEQGISRVKTTRPGMEWLWVCFIVCAGILWVAFYDVYMSPYLHLWGLCLFAGLPFSISFMVYCIWKMVKHAEIHKRTEALT